MKRFVVYMWFDDGDEGYVIADRNLVNALVPSDGIRSASYWRNKEAADNFVTSLQGYSKQHYVRHAIHSYVA